MKSIPINTLIPPNHKKLAWIQAIDWEQVERRVAERFAQIGPPKDAPLPTRLAISLAIFNYETGHLPEDAPHAWSEMPIYQFLSGATHYKMKLPCDPAVYCRWREHFGEAELEALIDSLGVVPRAQRKHTSLHYALSFEDTLTQLQEGLQSPPATRKDDSQKQEAPPQSPRYPTQKGQRFGDTAVPARFPARRRVIIDKHTIEQPSPGRSFFAYRLRPPPYPSETDPIRVRGQTLKYV